MRQHVYLVEGVMGLMEVWKCRDRWSWRHLRYLHCARRVGYVPDRDQ